MDTSIKSIYVLGLLLLAFAASQAAFGQTYPVKPIRLVPFPPGGTGDLLGRLAAKEMQASLGQPVVADNRPGAWADIVRSANIKAD